MASTDLPSVRFDPGPQPEAPASQALDTPWPAIR